MRNSNKVNHLLCIGLVLCLSAILAGIGMGINNHIIPVQVEGGPDNMVNGTGLILMGIIVAAFLLYFFINNRRS